MNAISDRDSKQVSWSTIVMFALGFWLSGSLILDSVIIPSLFASGMMSESGFASAGYLIFGVFNKIELLCAALVLTSVLVFRRNHNFTHQQETWATIFAATLMVIATLYTYFLIPQMSGLGLQLNLFATTKAMTPEMISLHWGYWILEATKFIFGATLLRWCYRGNCSLPMDN